MLLKNRNIRSDLIAKHANEAKRALESIKNALNSITNLKGSHENSRIENSRMTHKTYGKIGEGRQESTKSNDLGQLDVY